MAGNEIDINEKLLQIAKFNNKGQHEKAIKEYKQLLVTYRNDPKILNSMGDTYAKMQGESDNALRCYDQSADQYAKDGIWPTAIAILKKMLRMKPEKLDTKFKIAEFCIQMKSFNEAEQYLIEYGEFFISAGDVQKAIPAYEKVASISPDNMDRKIKLAELYFFTGNTDKMLITYQSVFNYYRAQKNITKTQDIFSSITAISNKNQLLMTATYFSIFVGYIEFLLSDTQDDERALGTAMDMITRLSESGEHDKAQSLCVKVIELRPDAVNMRFKLIDILDKAGDNDNLISAYVGIGKYFSERDMSRAEVLFKKVLQLDPSNPDAKAFFGAISAAAVPEKTHTEPVADEKNDATESLGISDVPEHAQDDVMIEGAVEIIHSSRKQEDESASLVDSSGLGISSTFDQSGEGRDLGSLDLTEVEAQEDDLKRKLTQDISISSTQLDSQEVPEFSPDEINSFATAKDIPQKKEEKIQDASDFVTSTPVHTDDDDDIEIEIEIDDDDVVTVTTQEDVSSDDKDVIQTGDGVILSQQTEDIDDKLGNMFTEFSTTSDQSVSILTEISDHENEFVPNLDTIVQEFKRGLEEQLEGDPQAHCDMGTSFLSMGMIDEAMDEFRKLTSIAHYKYRSHDGLAQCLLARDEYDAAIEEYFIILEFPNLTQDEMDATSFNLARTFFKKGDLIESKRYLTMIQQQDLFSKNDEFKTMQETFKKELSPNSEVPEINIDQNGSLTTGNVEEEAVLGNIEEFTPRDILKFENEVEIESLDEEKVENITVEAPGIDSGNLVELSSQNEVVLQESPTIDDGASDLKIQRPFESADSSLPVVENDISSRIDSPFAPKAVEKLDAEINKLRKEILSAKDNVADNSEKIQVFATQMQSLEQEMYEIRDTVHEVTQIKDTFGEFHETLEAYRERIDAKIQAVADDVSAVRTSFENKDSEITNDISQLKTDMEGYRDLSVREKEILNQFMKYREDFDAFADEISGMKEMVKREQVLETRIEDISRRVEQMAERDIIVSEIKNSIVSLSTLEERVAHIELSIQSVHENFQSGNQSQGADSNEENDKLRREIISLKTLIHDIDSKMYMLEMRDSTHTDSKRTAEDYNERPARREQRELSQDDSDFSELSESRGEDVLLPEEPMEKPVKKQTKKNKKDKISFL